MDFTLGRYLLLVSVYIHAACMLVDCQSLDRYGIKVEGRHSRTLKYPASTEYGIAYLIC